jgi:formiminotetrahydrofolate cyclodeaminase
MVLTELSCRDFAAELAAKKPVPGGGGAAALAGALGTALNSMVVNYSLGKKKLLQFEEQHMDILSRAEDLRIKMLDLVEKDAESFEPLSKAYIMPKETEQEQAVKEETLQKCLKAACEAPLETLRLSYEGILLHEELIEICTKTIVSDVGVGIQCLKAAINSAYLNVLINLNSITDEEYVKTNMESSKKLLQDGNKKADEVYERVVEILSN